MSPKKKIQEDSLNPLIHPPLDLDHIPLADRDYKIFEMQCEFKLFELYYVIEDKFVDKTDEIGLWEFNLPHYIYPQTFHSPEATRKCQAWYVPNQREIIAPTGEIIFTITAKTLDQMMQAPSIETNTPFSIKALTELYQKLYFSKRARIFTNSFLKTPNYQERIHLILPQFSLIKPNKLQL